MKRTFMKVAVASAIAFTIPFGGITAAQAAPTPTISAAAVNVASLAAPAAKKVTKTVSIKKVGNKTVSKKNSKATFKPSYSKSKGVKITSAKVTVKNSKGKNVVKNKNSASLKTGSYKMTTTVKYSYKSGKKTIKKTSKRTQSIKVAYKAPYVAPKVNISNITNKTVKNANSKATIKPNYKATKGAKVTSAKVTVKNSTGKKTITANKNSTSLKAGTYKISTKVSYTYKKGKKTYKKTATKNQTLKVTSPKAKPKAKPKTNSYSTSNIEKDATNLINNLRKSKGLAPLKDSGQLNGYNNNWVKSNFTKSIPFSSTMWNLESVKVTFAGDRNGKGLVDYMKGQSWFNNMVYSKAFTHMSVTVDNSGSIQKIGVALAKY